MVIKWYTACAEDDRRDCRMVLKRGMGIRTTSERQTRGYSRESIPYCMPTFSFLLIEFSEGTISPSTEVPARRYYNSSKVTGVCTLGGGYSRG